MVWDNVGSNLDHPLSSSTHILYGHDNVVSSVAINTEINIILSCLYDGMIIIHSLRDHTYIRTIING
jgi:hypothetical protein